MFVLVGSSVALSPSMAKAVSLMPPVVPPAAWVNEPSGSRRVRIAATRSRPPKSRGEVPEAIATSIARSKSVVSDSASAWAVT